MNNELEAASVARAESRRNVLPFEQQLRQSKARRARIAARTHHASPITKPTPTSILHPPSSSTGSAGSPFLTRRELAAVLKVSVRTIDRLAATGEIPVCRIGTAVRFHLPAVLQRVAGDPAK